jgi:predicted nucleic acid-binding protein
MAAASVLTLIDAGPIIAYFDQMDDWHREATIFIDTFTGQFVTSEPVITEVMWQLRSDHNVQNEFLQRVAAGVFLPESLSGRDFVRIAELNIKYAGLPADIADLSLLAIAERRQIMAILSLDREFDYYRIRRGYKNVHLRRLGL